MHSDCRSSIFAFKVSFLYDESECACRIALLYSAAFREKKRIEVEGPIQLTGLSTIEVDVTGTGSQSVKPYPSCPLQVLKKHVRDVDDHVGAKYEICTRRGLGTAPSVCPLLTATGIQGSRGCPWRLFETSWVSVEVIWSLVGVRGDLVGVRGGHFKPR